MLLVEGKQGLLPQLGLDVHNHFGSACRSLQQRGSARSGRWIGGRLGLWTFTSTGQFGGLLLLLLATSAPFLSHYISRILCRRICLCRSHYLRLCLRDGDGRSRLHSSRSCRVQGSICAWGIIDTRGSLISYSLVDRSRGPVAQR